MRDTMSIGSTPCDEDCAQVGTDNYARRARVECKAWINQLRRHFGDEPEGAQFRVQANSHDFGVYYDVEICFDDNYPQAVEYAFKAENDAPARWDNAAHDELLHAGQ